MPDAVKDIHVMLAQMNPVWEDIDANLAMLEDRFGRMTQHPDLIVLPEMFSTGFSMNAEPLAVKMESRPVRWMKRMSKKIGAHICGSMIVKQSGSYFNRLIWAMPDGALHVYDKRKLFKFSGEHTVYTKGGLPLLTIHLKGWKIRPFICYELRFPVMVRNTAPYYDAAIFIASWPEVRAGHWRMLLPARAVENQCYVIGVNRVGTDGLGFAYSGDSTVIDPLGKTVYHKARETTFNTVTLSAKTLASCRKRLPFLDDGDEFQMNPTGSQSV